MAHPKICDQVGHADTLTCLAKTRPVIHVDAVQVGGTLWLHLRWPLGRWPDCTPRDLLRHNRQLSVGQCTTLGGVVALELLLPQNNLEQEDLRRAAVALVKDAMETKTWLRNRGGATQILPWDFSRQDGVH